MHSHVSRPRNWLAAWVLAIAAVLMGAVLAADLPKQDEVRVREVVQQQLKAFAADDAAGAFGLADPGIRIKFGNAEHFLAMVRAHYPMVHRPASVLFLKPESDGTMAFQRVRMTDSAGTAWLVTYLLSRQQDKDWRISACLVVPDAHRVTT
jgi:hypothetical protein